MDNEVFRKSALDKVSSPEQLNEYMKVAGPGVWSILAGIAVVFVAFFVWGFMGSIPETVDIQGTALSPEGGALAVYCYLPIDETKQISEGMRARVSPDYAPKEQFGYIYGTVKSVGSLPVSADSLADSLGKDFAFVTLPGGNAIEVVIEPELADGALHWSTAKGAGVHVVVGSSCSVSVITAQRKPYELMFR